MAASRQFFVHEARGIAVAVKQGFCWPAFFFGSLWAAAKGLWMPLFPLRFVAETALWFLTGYVTAEKQPGLTLACLAATLIYAVVRGRHGNQWLRNGLLRKGYRPGSQR